MSKHQSVHTFFMMMLLLLLGVTMFLCIAFGVSSYQRMNEISERSSQEHIPYAYLMQKLRRAGNIEVVDQTLVLSDDYTVTYIYLYDGCLYELTTLPGHVFEQKAGEKLFEVEGFEVHSDRSSVGITYDVHGIEKEIVYSFRGEDRE